MGWSVNSHMRKGDVYGIEGVGAVQHGLSGRRRFVDEGFESEPPKWVSM